MDEERDGTPVKKTETRTMFWANRQTKSSAWKQICTEIKVLAIEFWGFWNFLFFLSNSKNADATRSIHNWLHAIAKMLWCSNKFCLACLLTHTHTYHFWWEMSVHQCHLHAVGCHRRSWIRSPQISAVCHIDANFFGCSQHICWASFPNICCLSTTLRTQLRASVPMLTRWLDGFFLCRLMRLN